MHTADLIEILEYNQSSAFLQAEQLNDYPGYAHIFRKAQQTSGLQGVYTLKDEAGQSIVPLIYVCEADSEEMAKTIHKQVWNQNIVPFLLMTSPQHIRLYSGFAYESKQDEQAIVSIAKNTREILEKLDGFQAEQIDEGHIWNKWGQEVKPSSRVDWKLLEQLDLLGQWLRQDLDRHTAHALIGKFVYLRYLRDRGILSDDRLAKCGLQESDIFGSNTNLDNFNQIIEYLEDWLNGAVFPLQLNNTETKHIQQIAAVFNGDEIDTGQYHLDFRAYDFAHIPIETLSVVYEQFIHADERGRNQGAYYTPVHLVNFMLDEMEAKKPLQDNVTVFDPACGSGAFLVQCYRRLIERTYFIKGKLLPSELRRLLEQHIFGVDLDKDACSVTGLSLVLTLLDYITPPDLKVHHNFKIPTLLGNNIIQSDFFAQHVLSEKKFDWVISNPPWREIKGKQKIEDMPEEDKHAFTWMKQNNKTKPVGGYQLAEAFSWKVLDNITDNGVIGMLMPAMCLFKTQSKGFRKAFFSQTNTWCVANFANLANVLFAGRSTVPAATIFYENLHQEKEQYEYITTYSPFLVNQESNLAKNRNKNLETWHFTINHIEIQSIYTDFVKDGDALHWKVAMWGKYRDYKLLKKINTKFSTFDNFKKHNSLNVHEGDIRSCQSSSHLIEHVSSVIGKNKLITKNLPKNRRFYFFPKKAIEKITKNTDCFKKGTSNTSISVSTPPHIIVSRTRRFAIFCNEFLAVPARQIGISGKAAQEYLLKALALYLVSDFSLYHQLFYASEFGVQKSVADLSTLDALPVSLEKLKNEQLEALVDIYNGLTRFDQEIFYSEQEIFLDASHANKELQLLEKKSNILIFNLLNLSKKERYLVEDLVHYRSQLLRGKTKGTVVEPPEETELQEYASILKSQLDAFLDLPDEQYQIAIYYDGHSGMMSVNLTQEKLDEYVKVQKVNPETSSEFYKLRRRLLRHHSQWFYFERNLTVFDGDTTYLFKPMQRLHWLRSQALVDADNLIADTLGLEVQ